MIILVFLITVLIVFAVQWYIARQKFYKFADNIPSAKNYGILGHGPHFLGKDDEGGCRRWMKFHIDETTIKNKSLKRNFREKKMSENHLNWCDIQIDEQT